MLVVVPSAPCSSMPVKATTTEVAPSTGASVRPTVSWPGEEDPEPPPHADKPSSANATAVHAIHGIVLDNGFIESPRLASHIGHSVFRPHMRPKVPYPAQLSLFEVNQRVT